MCIRDRYNAPDTINLYDTIEYIYDTSAYTATPTFEPAQIDVDNGTAEFTFTYKKKGEEAESTEVYTINMSRAAKENAIFSGTINKTCLLYTSQ